MESFRVEFGEAKLALRFNKAKQNKDLFCMKLQVSVNALCCLLA